MPQSAWTRSPTTSRVSSAASAPSDRCPQDWIAADLIHDEDLAYASRLQDAGVEVATTVVPGAPHGFESVAARTAIARDFRRAAQDWLGGHLSREG